MPCISVIVPVYRVEQYLARCVDSILRQTFRDFELILVDDGSPDNCGAFCDAYARQDSRIHVIHQENGGLSAARNSGIDWVMANSGSQWLTFIDSDDWVANTYLEYLYRGVEETGCLLSACDFFRTDGSTPWPDVAYSVARAGADDYFCADLASATVAWGKLYHRRLFETLRYPVGKLHEDEFTTYRAVYQSGSVAALPAKMYAYYYNPEGITQAKWSPKRMHSLEGVQGQIAFAREQKNDRLLRKAAEQYVYGTADQLQQIQNYPEHAACRREMESMLRQGLKLCRELGMFPFRRRFFWIYELAYPCKPLWWLLCK